MYMVHGRPSSCHPTLSHTKSGKWNSGMRQSICSDSLSRFDQLLIVAGTGGTDFGGRGRHLSSDVWMVDRHLLIC